MTIHKIPLTRLTYHIKFDQPWRKPLYAGSALRGQFGRHLRRTVCVTKLDDCTACPVRASCPYTNLFEPRAITPSGQPPRIPYILRDGHWGAHTFHPEDTWQFHHTLIGPTALQNAALIHYTWQQVMKHGFGPDRLPARIIRITDQTRTPLVQPDTDTLRTPANLTLPDPQSPHTLRIQLTTPWRYFEKKTQITPRSFRPEHFYHALYFRLRDLNDNLLHQTLPIRPDTFDALQKHPMSAQLHWQKLSRFSTRQNKHVHLNGIMGELSMHQPDPTLFPLIWAAKWLHIGKNTSFGLGALELTW